LIVNTKTRARNRHIAVAAGVLSVSVAMAGCATGGDTPSGGDGEIVVSSYGGSFQEAQQDALFTPFQEESGITVTGTEGTGFDPLKAQIDAGDVTWDVVSLESAPFANAVKNDLLEPLDYDVIDATGVDPAVVNDYGIGYIQFSTNLVWNKDLTEEITPEQFFDPSIKLPRALPRVVTSTLEFALIGDGVAPEDVYPLDVERAYAALDRIKDQVVAFKDASDIQALMEQGDVAVAYLPAGRAEDAIKAGANWGYSWAGAVRDTEYWSIAKGAKNVEGAQQFIAYATGAEPQAALAEAIPYGPSNADAYALLSEELNAKLPSSPDNAVQGVTLDSEWWADNLEELKTQWDAWLLQ
jgi:putative spermidine/putrescine transport system substrate-binding protein